MLESIQTTRLAYSTGKYYDFIVIGGGSAGACVAARLSEDPSVSVLLLEAGVEASNLEAKVPAACSKLQKEQHDWAYFAEPDEKGESSLGLVGHKSFWPRGKCLGGSSILNYMAYVRGARQDYDQWAKEEGASGWNWDAVLPLFCKSESNVSPFTDKKAHGYQGPITISSPPETPLLKSFVNAAERCDFQVGDYNNGDMEGKVSIFQQNIREGARCDTATAFLRAASRRSNLTIAVQAQATKLIINEQREVTGVIAMDLSTKGTHKVFANKEVVICGGAVNSPQLLLLSGIGPKNELERVGIECVVDNPHVGKHMEDHLAISLRFDAVDRNMGCVNKRKAELFPGGVIQLAKWLFFGNGLLATPTYDATLFYTSETFHKEHPSWGPDIQIGFLANSGDERTLVNNVGFERNFLFERLGPDEEGCVMVPCLLHLHSTGTIELRSKDPLEHPKIVTNYLSDKRDVKTAANALNTCLRLAKNMKGINPEPLLPPDMLARHGNQTTDEFWEEYTRNFGFTLYHPTSTCKIGCVVDANLQVIGIKNCTIADGSIMPHVISGNTNAPCIMIGEKCAEILQKKFKLNLAGGDYSSPPNPWVQAGLAVVAAGTTAIVFSKL